MAQLELFASAWVPPALAPPEPALSALAAALPPRLRFGTSSWTFPGWQGLVYRRAYRTAAQFTRESLFEYARFPLFRTVGIDRSFYAPLAEDELAFYAQQLPEGFVCVSKVWQELSTFVFPQHPAHGRMAGRQNPAFLDVERFEELVAGPYRRRFASHAGPFLFEISPLPQIPIPEGLFEAKLDAFLRQAPKDFRYAFELREPRLMTPAYFSILRAHEASHCFNQWARMPALSEQLRAHGPLDERCVVSRLLMDQGTSYEELKQAYAPFDKIVAPLPRMRDDVLVLAEVALARGAETFVIVDNKAEGSAPLTALALAGVLRERLR